MKAVVSLVTPNPYKHQDVILSTDHSSSSYGQPVVLIFGKPYGTMDLEMEYPGYYLTLKREDNSVPAQEITLDFSQPIEPFEWPDDVKLLSAADRAGYILSDKRF